MKWILLLLPTLLFSQTKVFFSSTNPDINIYIEKYTSNAEKWITLNDPDPYFTEWKVVKYRNLADKVVNVVKHRNLADITVSFLNNRNSTVNEDFLTINPSN